MVDKSYHLFSRCAKEGANMGETTYNLQDASVTDLSTWLEEVTQLGASFWLRIDCIYINLPHLDSCDLNKGFFFLKSTFHRWAVAKRILRTTEQKLVALDQGEMMDNMLLQDNKQNYIDFKLGCHKHILQCYLLYLFMFLQHLL